MEDEKEVRWCIVKDKRYEFYYQGKADYVHTITEKTIFNYDELPNSVKKNEKNEIIFLDSEKGLELLALDGKEILMKRYSSVQQQ